MIDIQKIRKEGTVIEVKDLVGHALIEKNQILILIECDTEETAKTAMKDLKGEESIEDNPKTCRFLKWIRREY